MPIPTTLDTYPPLKDAIDDGLIDDLALSRLYDGYVARLFHYANVTFNVEGFYPRGPAIDKEQIEQTVRNAFLVHSSIGSLDRALSLYQAMAVGSLPYWQLNYLLTCEKDLRGKTEDKRFMRVEEMRSLVACFVLDLKRTDAKNCRKFAIGNVEDTGITWEKLGLETLA